MRLKINVKKNWRLRVSNIIRIEDLASMYSPTFTKKDAIATGHKLVDDLFEAGEVDELKVFSNIVRLKEVANSADKAFRDRIDIPTAISSNGVEFTPKNGSKRLNYAEDSEWLRLTSLIKAREELLKVAQNSTIADEDGAIVPKVSVSFDKSSITIKF